MRGSDILATKKRSKDDERKCEDCEYQHSDNCDDCVKMDMWTPKDGAKVGTTTITMSTKGPGGEGIGKPVTFDADKLTKIHKQLDLEGKEVQYPIAPGEFDRWVERFTDALEDY